MIIALCIKDDTVEFVAETTSCQDAASFGQWFRIPDIPGHQLGMRENLFLLAHNTRFLSADAPLIGSRAGRRFFSPDEVWDKISGLFPDGFEGNIHVIALSSQRQTTSFAEQLKDRMNSKFPDTAFFASVGADDDRLPHPDSDEWIPV